MKHALVLGLCAAYGLSVFWTMPPGPSTTPDSGTYLAMAPIVPLGYPLVLRVFGANGAMVLQPMVFALALAWLGCEILRATANVTFALAVLLAIVLTPDLTAYHSSVLTESLFASGVMAILAAAMRFVRAPSWQAAALAAIIAGITVAVRTTALAFVPLLAVMVAMQWRRLPANRRAIAAAVLVPALGVIAGERIAARVVHGDALTSLTGRHLFAKAAMIDAPPAADPPGDPLRARVEHEAADTFAPIRALVRRAPREIRPVLTLYYETCLQWPCVGELRSRMDGLSEAQMNEIFARAAVDRIARAPLDFAALTATHYRSLWTAYKLRHPDSAAQLNRFIASNRPLPLEREAFALSRQDTLEFRENEPVRFIQPAVVGLGWVTGALALIGLAAAVLRHRLPDSLAIASLAALLGHGGLLFSALFAAGISRFMITLWPAIVIAMFFAAWYGVEQVARRRGVRREARP